MKNDLFFLSHGFTESSISKTARSVGYLPTVNETTLRSSQNQLVPHEKLSALVEQNRHRETVVRYMKLIQLIVTYLYSLFFLGSCNNDNGDDKNDSEGYRNS